MPDPEKIKRNLQRMAAAGATEAEMDAYVQAQGLRPVAERAAPQPRRRDALLPIAQGATLGFADEILGGVEGVARKFSGGSFREGYAEGRDRVRQGSRDYAAAKPKTNLALEIAGGLVTGGAGAARAGLARTGARVAQGAKVGAGYGAVAGAGSAEGGLSERITGAGVGAAGGALAGAAVPLAARAVRRGAESISRNARRLPAANRTLPATRGLDRDESKLAELFAADKKSPQTIRTQTEFLGDEGMLVDVGGPNVRGAARYAATKPGPAKSQMTEALTGRVWNEDEAIRSSVRQKFGNKSADEATQELEARMSTEAKPLYEAAYARGIIQNPVVDELLSRPAGRVAFKAAQRSAADEGVALPSGVVDVRALDKSGRKFLAAIRAECRSRCPRPR